MAADKIGNGIKASSLPSVMSIHSQMNKNGKAIYLNHTIRVGEVDNYIIEGSELKYCEFKNVGLALVLIYLQRMLLVEP